MLSPLIKKNTPINPNKPPTILTSSSFNRKKEETLKTIRGIFRTESNHVIMYDNEEVFSLVPTPTDRQISECIKHLRIEKGLQLLMKESPLAQLK